jgi:hypothetical protein
MAITPAEFKLRFPEFDSVSDARIQIFIDDAELELDEDRWGDLYDKGLSYLTAHLLYIGEQTSGGQGEGGGPLSTKAVGDVSFSFGSYLTTDNKATVFNSTSYGQEYYRLMIMVGMGAVAVTNVQINVIE